MHMYKYVCMDLIFHFMAILDRILETLQCTRCSESIAACHPLRDGSWTVCSYVCI